MTLRRGDRTWERNWDRSSASVPRGGNGHAGDGLAVGRVLPGQLGVALISGAAGDELLRDVVVLERDHGPVDQADELVDDGLGPRHQQRVLARDAVDGQRGNVGVPHVGLVEHVRVLVEAEQIARAHVPGVRQQVLEVA